MVLAMSFPADFSCHSSLYASRPWSTPPSDLIIDSSRPPYNWGHPKAYIQLHGRKAVKFLLACFSQVVRLYVWKFFFVFFWADNITAELKGAREVLDLMTAVEISSWQNETDLETTQIHNKWPHSVSFSLSTICPRNDGDVRVLFGKVVWPTYAVSTDYTASFPIVTWPWPRKSSSSRFTFFSSLSDLSDFPACVSMWYFS